MGSCEPSRRSFLVKSMADSVALLPHPNKPRDAGSGGAALEIVSEIAKTVRASTTIGSEDLKQRSSDSEKVMKTPASNQPYPALILVLHLPLSSYILNCFRRTRATMTSGNAANTTL